MNQVSESNIVWPGTDSTQEFEKDFPILNQHPFTQKQKCLLGVLLD